MQQITAVFFDIDGTLVNSHGAGREAFTRAIRHVFGVEDDLRFVQFAGATDLDVFRDITAHLGLTPRKKHEQEFFRQLPKELRQTIGRYVVTPCPGVKELLERLSEEETVLVGLLTGNEEECAQIKLKACDFHGHFMLGAFGREHALRAELARRALRRAKKHLPAGQKVGPVYVVGDTPSDIAAARAINAQCIAVATGVYHEDALKNAGATHVLPDLRDTNRVLDILGLQ
jgi:phosphoglycolate phosphatase-like HAD superfamily hydrolase